MRLNFLDSSKMSSIVRKVAPARIALGKQAAAGAAALRAKATTIAALPAFNTYLGGANLLLAVISLAVYWSSMGTYLTMGDMAIKFLQILALSAVVYNLGPLLPLTALKGVLVLFEAIILFYIIYWFVNGPSDKKAADNETITSKLMTQPDGTRCLSGTGTCDSSGKGCVKKEGNTIQGDIVKCGA